MYYRVAIQVDPLPTWQWRSIVLSSLQTLFQFLRALLLQKGRCGLEPRPMPWDLLLGHCCWSCLGSE